MGIVERAVALLDRAQGRMTAMTQQAARRVHSASEIAALEERLTALRAQLEQSVTDVGKLVFRQWKSGNAGKTDAIDVLCRAIDSMNSEYQRLLGELADLKASAASPATVAEVSHSSRFVALPLRQPAASAAAPAEAGIDSATLSGMSGVQGVGSAFAAAGRPRSCPECLSEVLSSQPYCPSCGIRMQ